MPQNLLASGGGKLTKHMIYLMFMTEKIKSGNRYT